MSVVESCSDCALGGDERAARALNRATATALHGCHHFQWCGVGVSGTARRLLGLRPRRRRARSASAQPRDCDSPSRVPPLPVVRCRAARAHAPCRSAGETTTGSGGTHVGCRPACNLLALRARHRAKTQATCGFAAGRLIISYRQRRLRSNRVSWLPPADAPCRSRRASCPARGACTPASTTATGVRAAPAPRADLRRCSRGASRSCGGSCGG